jgi:uncharacterized membrane protein
MASRASIAGHPVHPMLVVFPIGLFVFSFICDLIYLGTENGLWRDIAYYSMAGGILGGLAAAVPGLIDFLGISDERVRRIAALHMIINVSVIILYAVNLWIRSTPGTPTLSIWLSGFSVALLAVSGWLGGEMVYVHGVGVGPAGAETTPSPRMRPSTSRR